MISNYADDRDGRPINRRAGQPQRADHARVRGERWVSVAVTHSMTTETNSTKDSTSQKTTPSVADLTAFKRDILWAIRHSGGVEYGLGIRSRLGDYRPEEILHGRLYPNLDDLQERGFIEKNQRDKRANHYSLTDAGNRALDARLVWQETGSTGDPDADADAGADAGAEAAADGGDE